MIPYRLTGEAKHLHSVQDRGLGVPQPKGSSDQSQFGLGGRGGSSKSDHHSLFSLRLLSILTLLNASVHPADSPGSPSLQLAEGSQSIRASSSLSGLSALPSWMVCLHYESLINHWFVFQHSLCLLSVSSHTIYWPLSSFCRTGGEWFLCPPDPIPTLMSCPNPDCCHFIESTSDGTASLPAQYWLSIHWLLLTIVLIFLSFFSTLTARHLLRMGGLCHVS